MKNYGIIMAGGKGTRLNPITQNINKHLLPIYDKPMIYYPLSVLIYANIKNILIICNEKEVEKFKKLLIPVEKKNKISIKFHIQKNIGGGIAEGLKLSKPFVNKAQKIILMLGDNFFYGREFPKNLEKIIKKKTNKSHVFLSEVSKPQDYGIAYLKQNKIYKIIEKPKNFKSNLAITGLYVYNKNIFNLLQKIKPSKRNELEISSLNKLLLKKNHLDYVRIGKGTSWFDLGSYENIFQCSELIRLIEKRQGIKISNIDKE